MMKMAPNTSKIKKAIMSTLSVFAGTRLTSCLHPEKYVEVLGGSVEENPVGAPAVGERYVARKDPLVVI